MPPLPPGGNRSQISKQEFYDALHNEIDPANLAGEGFTATDEIARPADISDPWVRAKVEQEGNYWPTPRKRR